MPIPYPSKQYAFLTSLPHSTTTIIPNLHIFPLPAPGGPFLQLLPGSPSRARLAQAGMHMPAYSYWPAHAVIWLLFCGLVPGYFPEGGEKEARDGSGGVMHI